MPWPVVETNTVSRPTCGMKRRIEKERSDIDVIATMITIVKAVKSAESTARVEGLGRKIT